MAGLKITALDVVTKYTSNSLVSEVGHCSGHHLRAPMEAPPYLQGVPSAAQSLGGLDSPPPPAEAVDLMRVRNVTSTKLKLPFFGLSNTFSKQRLRPFATSLRSALIAWLILNNVFMPTQEG